MTLENFNYRTNPLFLRNQFAANASVFGIPTVPKPSVKPSDVDNLRLLRFDEVKRDNQKHINRMVHFFLYDYNFEKIWQKPQLYVDLLRPYKGMLTPDFSMYIEMPIVIQLYNTFRNRWCGAYFAEKGLKVIPTVNWGLEESYDFCFAGIEKGSAVAISTYMFHEHGNHASQKELFLNGYNEMMRRIEPEYVICYSEPFSEMTGNIVYVNYDLSSWQHMNDDIVSHKWIKRTYGVRDNPFDSKTTGSNIVHKGGGSAYGGTWIPKSANSERFYGEPNTIERCRVETKKGGFDVDVRYDDKGRADYERQYTDHSKPHKHSDPHDHTIDWSSGKPDLSSPINYFDGNIPEFKKFEIGVKIMNKDKKSVYNPDDYKFESLSEFKSYLSRGWNIGFEYNSIEYGIEGHNNSFDIWIYNEDILAEGITLDEVLEYKLDGVKIKDLILSAEITERLC